MVNMKKIFSVLLLLMVMFLNVQVNAEEVLPDIAKSSLDNFVINLNFGDTKVYDYIDKENNDLYINVEKYLNKINLQYNIREITRIDDVTYNVKTTITASGNEDGANWNVSGFSVNFKLRETNDKYLIIETDLFEKVGSDNVIAFVLKIFKIIGTIFLGIGLIITIVVVILLNRNKKKRNGEF